MASAQVTITQLPAAGPITGNESVPIVQNGQTVQTTTGAIAVQPTQTQSFLTATNTPSLANSRTLAAGSGLSLTDGGAQGTMQVNITGAASSLNAAGNGFMVKTGISTLVPREIQVGTGLGITNGTGVAGNPVVTLGSFLASIQSLSGSTGLVGVNGGAATSRSIAGTSNQISVSNGDASAGNPTVALVSNPILPGTGGVALPTGSTSQRAASQDGTVRYNSETSRFEGYQGGSWVNLGSGDGSVTLVQGTANQITVTNGSTTPLVAIASNPVIPGNASLSVPSGTTAQRAASPVNGMIRYNTQIALFEGYINGAWQNFAAGATGVVSIATGTGLTGGPITSSGTISIDSTVATLTGTQTLTNKTLASPEITGTYKLTGTGATAYTPFIQTFASSVTNLNGYQLNYIQNTNNGSDASVDYVAYNDASDVDSYFVDMGIASSNYTNALNTVFPANGGYVYTGGGTSGQASALLLGTSNSASDITLFTGGTLLANTRATIKGSTGNFLIGTTTDTGYKLNVNGTTYFGGASTFGSTVLLNANPTLALQAATKQYVDTAVSTGFFVHPPVVYATTAALAANTYNNGTAGVGATLTANANGALSVDGNAVTVSQRILVKDEVAQANNGVYTVTATGSAGAPYVLTRATDFDTAGAGEIASNAYFFVTSGATQAGDSFVLSQTATITVGTTALPFTLFNDQAVYSGGTNITVAGQIISVSGTIAATNGGTGTNTVTTGDLLYGSAANTWSKLPLGVAYKSLIINAAGTQVEWNAIPLNQTAAVSGQLSVSNGGTGASTLTGLAYGNGTSAFTAATAAQVVAVIGSTAVTNATNATNAATATNATNVATTATSTNTNFYIPFVASSTTGNQALGVDVGIAYNPSTKAITAGVSGGTF